MKNTYNYSLLQYRHSIVLGEVINIGLLIYFPQINAIRFLYPQSFNRLRNLYSSFPENTILSYFEYFKLRVTELNRNPDIFHKYELRNSLKELIEAEFLQADSSMLQFSNYNKAILYTENIDHLTKKLSNFYFPLDVIEFKNELLNSSKKINKDDWIKPDLKNKIVRVEKDFIFLPNKNELSF